jgi:hypothetical protein
VSTSDKYSDGLSTEHLSADLKGRSIRGGVLTLASQGTQFFTSLAMTVVLAHLLTPVDFGLVAMVTAIRESDRRLPIWDFRKQRFSTRTSLTIK